MHFFMCVYIRVVMRWLTCSREIEMHSQYPSVSHLTFSLEELISFNPPDWNLWF